MEFHILDLIAYILLCVFIWKALMPNDFKEEIGLIAGWTIMTLFTVIYLILFAFWPNWNWIDIAHSFESGEIIKFKL